MNSVLKSGLHIILTGRVQGVLMRRRIKAEADRLGISGFAENREDGSVRVAAEGPREKLEVFLRSCSLGGMFARVESVGARWTEANADFRGFAIRRRGTYFEDKVRAIKNLSLGIQQRAETLVLPTHVAVIPDGNRRWAKEKGLPTLIGHERGLNNLVSLLDETVRLKIPYFTAWGFSTENWKRESTEVKYLMSLFKSALDTFEKKFLEKKVQFRHFGRKDRLPKELIERLGDIEKRTEQFSGSAFGLALDYGGRDELLRAIEKLRAENKEISEEAISSSLDTAGFPDPDLVIRTSGEMRTSGLMAWQSAYAELYFAKENFPAFGAPEFRVALADFNRRKRNFGA